MFEIYELDLWYVHNNKIPRDNRPHYYELSIDSLIEHHLNNEKHVGFVEYLKKRKEEGLDLIPCCPAERSAVLDKKGPLTWVFGPKWYMDHAPDLGLIHDFKKVKKTRTVKKKKISYFMGIAVFEHRKKRVCSVLTFKMTEPDGPLTEIKKFSGDKSFTHKGKTYTGVEAGHNYWHSL